MSARDDYPRPVTQATYEGLCDEVDSLRALVRDLTTDDECYYDHNNYCQAHYRYRPCPHTLAKLLVPK